MTILCDMCVPGRGPGASQAHPRCTPHAHHSFCGPRFSDVAGRHDVGGGGREAHGRWAGSAHELARRLLGTSSHISFKFA